MERGLAANTLSAYRRDLARYSNFLAAQGVDQPGNITRHHVTAFVQALSDGSDAPPPWGVRSAARTVVAVRGLHKFWALEGTTTADPASDVHPPMPGKRLPKAISVGEVTRILEAAGSDSATGLRDRALLEFLYSTGARISEAVGGLDVDDVSLEDTGGDPAIVRLFGKGSKERLVPPLALTVPAPSGGPMLFAAGRCWRPRARAPPRRCSSTPGVAGSAGRVRGPSLRPPPRRRISPKMSLHTRCAIPSPPTSWRVGADVRVVQELLGHASVTTTQVYTLVTADTLREVYAAAHPRALG